MGRKIISFLLCLGVFAAVGVSNSEQASARTCGYKYTAPRGMSLLTAKEVLARIAGHTVVGHGFKYYFGPGGDVTYFKDFGTWPGTWHSCGPVVVFRWFNPDHDTERLLVIQSKGQVTFYALDGDYVGTYFLKKGRQF